jgi:hypothetical protein
MEILKYIDVLIGLAVVMVLLSPLVSALTQFWMWLSNARATRLKVGLAGLIQQLDGDAYESFEAIEITGLPAGAAVTFQQPAGIPPIVTNASPARDLVLKQNVAAMLRATAGNLLNPVGGVPALAMPAAAPPPAPPRVIQLWARGAEQTWQISSQPTNGNGDTTVSYRFLGPAQFASYQCVATVPAGHTLTITVASGDFQGTPVDWDAATGRFSYRAHVRPVPASHALKLHLTDAAGAPAPGVAVTLAFDRNAISHPVPAPATWAAGEADKIANAVLLHPMIAQPAFMGISKERKGEVVQREELIRILLEFAAKPATPEQQKLRQILANDGVPDPTRALADIRAVAQQLELTAPALAAHERVSKAILTAAQSSFVGRINNWFDQIMERTTSEYKFRAQLVTVVGAALVAASVQMDSIDLLKRLSTDDKLRESLVAQAEHQQQRLDQQVQAPTPERDQDEIQLAKARRDEIEANLAKLRDPQLGVLPDHFIWQPLPRARLIRNPDWGVPYSRRLELVVGASVYPLEPQWSSDVLGDIETAIRNSGAPVTMKHEKRTQARVTGKDVEQLQIRVGEADGLTHVNGIAQAKLDPAAAIGNEEFTLIVGYEPKVTIKTAPGVDLKTAIEKSTAAVSTRAWPILQAVKRDARWIELRRRPDDPTTDILLPTEIVDGSAHFDDLLFTGAKKGTCSVVLNPKVDPDPTPCSLSDVATKLQNEKFKFKVDSGPIDHLVLTSRRLGALQLRSVPGKPDTNMLNSAPESSQGPRRLLHPSSWVSFDTDLLSNSWRGMLLTWILLSLGASFWYDALKDLLKLRSSLAKQDEDARKDRRTNTSPPVKAG